MMAQTYDLLRYFKQSDDVWFTTHTEIAQLVRSCPELLVSTLTQQYTR